jgi:hypothetical protein
MIKFYFKNFDAENINFEKNLESFYFIFYLNISDKIKNENLIIYVNIN